MVDLPSASPRNGGKYLRVNTQKAMGVFMEKISVLLSLLESVPDVKVMVDTPLKGLNFQNKIAL